VRLMSTEVGDRGRAGITLWRQAPYLGPMLAWMAVIALLSSDIGSKEHTADGLFALVRWFFPHVERREIAPGIEAASWSIRKLAHVCEYAILALLACRWVRFSFAHSRRLWQARGLAIAASYAALDELHQAFVASRSAGGTDVLIDWGGALIGAAFYAWYIHRARAPDGGMPAR